MYTTHEQFEYYKDFAYKVFDFLNMRINRFINCTLEVDYADMINFTFANIRRPNKVFLHIDNIVKECGNGYNKNAVCSMIIIALTHELYHVEQIMSQQSYRSDFSYKSDIEDSVNAMAYNTLISYKNTIDIEFQIDLDLTYLQDRVFLSDMKKYQSWNTVEGIYKSIFMNIIFRNDQSYYDFEKNVLDKYDGIAIIFQNGYNFLIKSEGEFCASDLNNFIAASNIVAGKYDRYTINASMDKKPYRDKRDVAVVTFTLSNRQIYPMIFGKDN